MGVCECSVSIPIRFNYNDDLTQSFYVGGFVSIPIRFNYNVAFILNGNETLIVFQFQ